jgi:hypothetical protein
MRVVATSSSAFFGVVENRFEIVGQREQFASIGAEHRIERHRLRTEIDQRSFEAPPRRRRITDKTFIELYNVRSQLLYTSTPKIRQQNNRYN